MCDNETIPSHQSMISQLDCSTWPQEISVACLLFSFPKVDNGWYSSVNNKPLNQDLIWSIVGLWQANTQVYFQWCAQLHRTIFFISKTSSVWLINFHSAGDIFLKVLWNVGRTWHEYIVGSHDLDNTVAQTWRSKNFEWLLCFGKPHYCHTLHQRNWLTRSRPASALGWKFSTNLFRPCESLWS